MFFEGTDNSRWRIGLRRSSSAFSGNVGVRLTEPRADVWFGKRQTMLCHNCLSLAMMAVMLVMRSWDSILH